LVDNAYLEIIDILKNGGVNKINVRLISLMYGIDIKKYSKLERVQNHETQANQFIDLLKKDLRSNVIVIFRNIVREQMRQSNNRRQRARSKSVAPAKLRLASA